MKNQQKKPLIKKQPMLVLILAVFIFIISGGYFYYRYEKKIIRKEQYSNLMTIADLKINQILHWREERLADAHVIAESPFIRQNFQRWLLSQDSTLGKDLLERFALLRYNYKYEDVIIVSDGGKLLLGLNTNSKHIDSKTIDYCKKALQDEKAFLSDFYFSPAHDIIRLDIFAPILNDRNVPVAVLVLRVNPYDYLYPLIQSWPTSSKSAETLIIRRDGDSILYENELRHISNTALKLRIPLTSIKVPSVQAVLGHIGIFEGLDYRGVRVLADMRPVPGTSWFMIAKVDQSEIFSELKYRTVVVIIIALLLLLFFGIGISWLYNNRQKNIYRKLLETGTALQESERKFRDTIKFLDQGYYSCMMDGVVLEHNQAFNRILGIDISKDLKGAKLPDFWLNPDDRKVYLQELMTMGFIRNYLIDAKTGGGEKVVVMVNSHLVKDEQGKPVRIEGTFTDFTELRQAEEKLRKLSRIYSLLSDINQAIVRTHEPKELFEKVCKISVEQGGFGMAWIGLIDELSQKLWVIAQAGRTNGYLEQIDISLRGEPLSYCPIDSALRQGKHNICKIIENEEMAPCQKIAFDLGFRSSASFPLKVSDILKGALTFYSDQPDFFDEAELKLLDELALDISFAMEYAEKEDERKRAEETLKASEKRFRITAGSLIDVVYEWDLKEKIEWFGDIDGIMGYPEYGFPRTLAGWAARLHPEDTAKVMEMIEGHLKRSEPYISEYRVMNKEGEWRWWTARGTALRDEQNIPYWWIGSITDITERKLVEETLRESEARYKTLVENIPQKIFMKDRDYRFISINENFARDLGISPEEIVGKVDHDFFSTELADKYRADDVRIFKTGETEELEEKYVVAGKETWVNTIKTPVQDKNGEIVGVLGVFWDITERKRAEEMIIKLNEELELKVKQRTELLEAANKELEAFSYSVSHDLRAPLRSVHGYTKILMEEYQNTLDNEGKRICGIISSSATQMGELIDDLLSFSRIGRTSMNSSLLDMRSIVQSAYEETCPDYQKSKTKLKIGKLHKGFGDANLLKLVWTNLISNAIKYSSKEKSSEISIGSTLKDHTITYSVKDNGVGFDMKYKHKLFGVFQRLHSETEFEGNGVGLAIVQRIILKHGGRVWAESEVGKGATFYFSLPVNGVDSKK